MLYFVTGNKNKFNEASDIIPDLKQINLDLVEIQSLNGLEIIKSKLLQAHQIHPDKNLIVEDISFEIQSLNRFPGPLIKWLLQSLGAEGIWDLMKNQDSKSAQVVCNLGYIDSAGNTKYFEALLDGQIVAPQGDNGFGFDPIFRPLGHNKTLAEMNTLEKNEISYRAGVFRELKEYLS